MPSQSDYSGGESTLVPAALTAYRHFCVGLLKNGQLSSPGGYRAAYDVAGADVWTAECRLIDQLSTQGAPPSRGLCACSACEETYQRQLKIYNELKAGGTHKSPDLDCKCGFYAHYDPETDFYKGLAWYGREEDKFEPCLYGEMRYGTPLPYQAVVRSVVELSGTVVMGSLGVRAEKMKIVAMAIDWPKHMYAEKKYVEPTRRPKPAQIDFRPYSDSLRIAPSFEYEDVPGYWTTEGKSGRPDDAMAIEIEKKILDVASAYGAKLYVSAEQMYAEHPKPDLSALGITPPEKKEEHSPLAGMTKTWGQLRQSLTQSFYQAMQQSSWGPPAGGWIPAPAGKVAPVAYYDDLLDGKPKKKHGTRRFKDIRNDAFRDALEAKQNKPAPPGSGIDRRRGKLR